MSEHKPPAPRNTFWGDRIETVPQGFKQRLKQLEAEKEKALHGAAAEAVEAAAERDIEKAEAEIEKLKPSKKK